MCVCECVGPVAGLVTLHSSCWEVVRGQAAGVDHRKVYRQSSMAEVRKGRDSWGRTETGDTGLEKSRQVHRRGLPSVCLTTVSH